MKKGVSLSRFDSLAKVIKAGGVTAAADGDSNTQSKFSRQIGDLDDALGERLFVRDGRGMRPTLAAKQLAAAYSAFEAAVDDLVLESKGRDSVVRIGAGDSVFKWMLLPVMASLEGQFRSVSFELHNLRTQAVVDSVISGTVDIGVAELRTNFAGITASELRTLEFGLYYDAESFGDCETADVLKAGKLIGLSGRGSYVRNCHEQQRKFGCSERFWLTFDSLPMVAGSMVQSKASAFLPIEMKDDLEEQGFRCIQDTDMIGFSRKYSLVLNKHTHRIRHKVAEVAGALENLVS